MDLKKISEERKGNEPNIKEVMDLRELKMIKQDVKLCRKRIRELLRKDSTEEIERELEEINIILRQKTAKKKYLYTPHPCNTKTENKPGNKQFNLETINPHKFSHLFEF